MGARAQHPGEPLCAPMIDHHPQLVAYLPNLRTEDVTFTFQEMSSTTKHAITALDNLMS